MKTSQSLIAAGLLLSLALPTFAQDQTDPVTRARNSVADDLVENSSTAVRQTFSAESYIDYIALVARRTSSLVQLLQQYYAERTDQQIGATASAAGSTTLVSRGTVPKILGLAVENGAVTQSQSGTTVTFRSSLGGSVRALAGKGFFQLSPGDDPALALLNRLSVSASFDTSRGNDTATTASTTGATAAAGSATTTGNVFTGDRNQLSQWTARLELINHRDPQSRGALDKWRMHLRASQRSVSHTTRRLYEAIEKDPVVVLWVKNTHDAIEAARPTMPADASKDQLAGVLKMAEDVFPTPEQLDEETRFALDDYEKSSKVFFKERHDVLLEVASGALVTLEYTNDRPVVAPETSNVRLIGQVGGTVDVIGNASVTFFNQIPSDASGSLRDLQLSAQLDVKLGTIASTGPFVLSFSGKYLHQFENSYDDAGKMILDTKGTTAIGQLKLTIPAGKDTGVKIPLSITFANRTDLIKESIVRANIGVTYDLDSVFSKFKP